VSSDTDVTGTRIALIVAAEMMSRLSTRLDAGSIALSPISASG
jgi:hypothetical protein